MYFRILAFTSLLGSALTGEALTERQAIERALRAHPALDAQDARVAAAEGSAAQAALKPNFTLYLQSENTRFWGQPRFNYANASDNWAYVGQTIETAGKRPLRVELARVQTARSRLDRDLVARQLTQRVSAAFWAAVGTARLAALAHEQAKGFSELVENNRRRVSEGVLPGVDLIRSNIELRRLQAAAGQMELDARRARLALFREMAAEDEGAELAGALDERRQWAETGAGRFTERVEWRQSQQMVTAAGVNIRAQQAQARPNPMLLYGYKRTAGFDTIMGGLVVDIPWRNRNQGGIAAAIAERRAAEASQRALRVQLEVEIATYTNEVRTRAALLDATLLPAQSQTEEVLTLARRAYLEGGIDLLRLIDAERIYFETRSQVVRTQMELKQAEAQLAFAMGETR